MLNSTMLHVMKRGTKMLMFAGFASFVAVACVVGAGVPSPQARDAASQIERAITDYRGGRPAPRDDDNITGRRFATAYQSVRNSYVRPTEDEGLILAATQGMREAFPDPAVATDSDLIEAAIHGMLDSLDDYSVYLDREAFARLHQEIDGRFGGLGIEISKDDTGLKVISPIDGTPAMRAGIQPEDKITHADGSPLADLTLRESVELLRGKPGSDVTITVVRDGTDPFDVVLTREIIRIIGVKARMEGDVGYIRLTHFVRGIGDDVRDEMARLKQEAGSGGLSGFVIDLRNNPGGLLDESIEVAGAFLSGGLVVSTKSRRYSDEFNADAADPSDGLPIVVLINKGSASASEIVAGAIKYRDRGVIVGEKSFGKGSVQSTFEFPGGGGLKLTTALYYTPSGKTVEGGIEPSIEALDDPDTEEVDEALELALDVVRAPRGGHSVLWNSGTVKN